MQQLTTIVRDNSAARPSCNRNRLSLTGDCCPVYHKGSSNLSRRSARVQDGEERGVAATGGYIREKECGAGVRRAQHITAAADADEVGKVHRPFRYDTATIRRGCRIDGDDGRVGLIVARAGRGVEIGIDRLRETSGRRNCYRDVDRVARSQQILDIDGAAVDSIRVLQSEKLGEACSYLAFSKVPRLTHRPRNRG